MRSDRYWAIAGFTVAVYCHGPTYARTAPSFGSAASFSILGGSRVANTGATRAIGNVGVSPGNIVSGFPPGVVEVGSIFRDDPLARQARIDSDAVFDDLSAGACHVINTGMPGGTLPEGVYCFPTADVLLTGTLILDAERNPDAVWIFRIAGSLTTAAGSAVRVAQGGYDGNVFWQIGGALTAGARTTLAGNILARGDITLQDGASLSGRLLTRGAVTLSANRVSLCCAPITLLPAFLPDGFLGVPYSVTITAAGGLAPYAFAVTSGSLPTELKLTPEGVLTGTPTTVGTFPLTITATDSLGCTGTAIYSVSIDWLGVGASVPTLAEWALLALFMALTVVAMRRLG